MKIIGSLAIALVGVAFSVPAYATATSKPASTSQTYSCEELTGIDYEYVGSMVYYVKGHYDAKHDTWTDYGPKDKTVTADVENEYVPVRDVYAYCSKNPKHAVIKAVGAVKDAAKQKH